MNDGDVAIAIFLVYQIIYNKFYTLIKRYKILLRAREKVDDRFKLGKQ